MFCGTGSFSHIDDDPLAPSTPKSSKKKQSKNPYSARGLDKFSMVLAELEARREKIMASTGSQGIAMVRFMYDNSQDWVPIIVRLREQKSKADDVKQLLPPPTQSEIKQESEVVKESSNKEVVKKSKEDRKVKKSFSWNRGEGLWRWKAAYYWPLVMVLILLCLMMFGRVFAICCTSIWWYMVPTMKDWSGKNVRKSMKRKEYGRRLSDKRLGGNLVVASSSQAKKMGGGVQELASPRAHVNGKRG